MNTKRFRVSFTDDVAADTFDSFAVVAELFGQVYRMAERTLVILCDPSKTVLLRLQLDEWQQQRAVRSWTEDA